MKSVCLGPVLSTGLPDNSAICSLIVGGHSLDFGQLPDYGVLIRSFKSLAERMGYYVHDSGPLHSRPCNHEFRKVIVNEPLFRFLTRVRTSVKAVLLLP